MGIKASFVYTKYFHEMSKALERVTSSLCDWNEVYVRATSNDEGEVN